VLQQLGGLLFFCKEHALTHAAAVPLLPMLQHACGPSMPLSSSRAITSMFPLVNNSFETEFCISL
jgi:hypothetical protein